VESVIARLNARLGYIKGSIEKLRACRSILLLLQQASELREDLDKYDRGIQEFVLIAEDYPDWTKHRKLCTQAQKFVEERDRQVISILWLCASHGLEFDGHSGNTF